MTLFDSREKAFEDRYAHDMEMQFKISAKRNKLVGLWAAGKMGIGQENAEEYAREVILADFEEPGDADVIRKLSADFSKAGMKVGEDEIRYQLSSQLKNAKQQFFGEE